MFVDACAIIALLSDEPEAERVSQAIAGASKRITSPVAVLEAVLGLARPDKFGLSVEALEPLVMEFLDERGIEVRDLPPAKRRTITGTVCMPKAKRLNMKKRKPLLKLTKLSASKTVRP